MTEDKIKFFGTINQAKGILEQAEKEIHELWNTGEIRMLTDDIELINKIEREIRGTLKQISAFKDLFSGISNHRVEDEK